MYYPKQIPYLLNKTFKKNIKYTEYHFKELESYIMCIWQMRREKKLDNTICNYILPDACIDIVIDFENREICCSGFSRETELLELKGNVDYLGVRFKPGAFYLIFGIDADKIMDTRTPFADIENQKYLENIFSCDKDMRINFFKNYLITKAKDLKPTYYLDVADGLYNSPKDKTVNDIAKKFGYNNRQLFRLFKKYYGISPKVLLNILRLHLCLNLLLDEKKTLCDIAGLCGFYDQSHLIKEIKRYTGISPLQILENSK